ncbi:ricin B lectin:Parallel beta-helix [Annulohypoxylon stygium]|nr:ricin B lectin:Parallel beta-helix [Annulohypoxylon stygium]
MARLSILAAVLALVSAIHAAECGSGTPDATVTGSGSSFKATKGSSSVYSGSDYRAAIQAALDSISSGQRVAVMASGSIGANTITISSGKIFEGCGTIDTGNRAGHGAIESLDTTDVKIPFLKMTGNPYFGLRFYGTKNLALGQITMNLSGGLGIRFERDNAANSNVTMDTINVTGAGSHAVETWNIDGLEINQVIAKDVGECGLLLQKTTNAHVGLVDGDNVAAGTGYATFRMANNNGQNSNGNYNTNVYVDRVKSRGGGRGIFCVSQSGAAVITEIDLADNGNNAILIENCYNLSIRGGKVNGGGEVRISARDEFPNTKDIWITLTVDGTTVRESPCGENINWTLQGAASKNICS